MISCTEFIPAYSELFKYLHEKGGKAAVQEFWDDLSDRFLANLKDEVECRGLRGCWNYWARTLNEESGDFSMTLDEKAGEFRIDMHHCPSKGRLLELKHMDPYPDYCKHCDALYRRVLEPLGYAYSLDTSHCDKAACVLMVSRKNRATQRGSL